MKNKNNLNKLKLDRIIESANFKKLGGLLPVVTQDASSNKVLMQAFMNEEALKLTLQTGKVHYWSRTRKKIWLKGESSGHTQILKEAYLDCDKDAILLLVHQIGVCCHTGAKTCFHNQVIGEGKSMDNKNSICFFTI